MDNIRSGFHAAFSQALHVVGTPLNVGYGIVRGATALATHAYGVQRLKRYEELERNLETLQNWKKENEIYGIPLNIVNGKEYQKFCKELDLKPTDFHDNLDTFQRYVQAKREMATYKNENQKELLKNLALNMMPLMGLSLSKNISTVDKSRAELFFEPAQCVLSLALFQLSALPDVLGNQFNDHNEIVMKQGFSRIEIDVNTPVSKRKIECWEKKHEDSSNRPAVVIFHANACTGSSMDLQARYYFDKGYDVYMPTIGGYPGSPGVKTSEGSMYQDIEAIKDYLAEKGVHEVGFHGTSLGGAAAIHAASTDNPSTLKTAFIVADQTFTTAEDVAGNLTANILGKALRSVGKGAMRAGLPKGEPILLPSGKIVTSNGLDSRSKLGSIKEKEIPIMFITASKDVFTGKKKGSDGHFQNDFAHEMSEVVYPGEDPSRYVISLTGHSHASPFNIKFQEDNEEQKNGVDRAKAQMDQFLLQTHLGNI